MTKNMKNNIQEAKQTAKEIFFLGEEIENIEINRLINMLEVADDLYFNGQQSFLTDQEYDTVKNIVQQLDSSNKYFDKIGSEVRSGKVKLPFPMGSLTQAYQGDITKWVEKYQLSNQQLVISDKIDGISVLILYKNHELQIAYSRGNGIEGADITRHIKKIPTVPKTIDFSDKIAIRGEAVISEKNFQIINEKGLKSRNGQCYKNARNTIAGLINAENNPDWVYQYVDIVVYDIIEPNNLSKIQQLDILKNNNFIVVPYITKFGYQLDDHVLIQHVQSRCQTSKYAIDGIVIEVDNVNKRKEIKPTKQTLNPEYARKYKVLNYENLVNTRVVDVEWNISKTGYLKPRIKVEPVNLLGVTITYATGFNAKFIYDNKVGPGSVVEITRSGDVIPFIQKVISPANIDDYHQWFVSKLSQIGKWEWNQTSVDVYLIEDHPEIQLKKTIEFFTLINAPMLKEGNIEKLSAHGFDTPNKIIKLTKQQLFEILGENGKKIYDGLQEKLNDIPVYVLMAASGCFGRGIGIKKLKKLYEAAEGNLKKFLDIQFIESVDGFDNKTAQLIINGNQCWEQFFNDISNHVKISQYNQQNINKGIFSNQFIVFTGFRDSNLQNEIIKQGGNIQSAVSKKTTLVIAADRFENSTKLKKARELNINIISLSEAWSMLE